MAQKSSPIATSSLMCMWSSLSVLSLHPNFAVETTSLRGSQKAWNGEMACQVLSSCLFFQPLHWKSALDLSLSRCSRIVFSLSVLYSWEFLVSFWRILQESGRPL